MNVNTVFHRSIVNPPSVEVRVEPENVNHFHLFGTLF